MQCGIFPGAFIVKRTFCSPKAQAHPQRLFVAQNVHNTTHQKNIQKIRIHLSTSSLQFSDSIHRVNLERKPADASEVSDVSRRKVLEENAYRLVWEDAEAAERLRSPISLSKRRRFVH